MDRIADIITTSDGSHSLRSRRFDVSYHSIHGAIQESEHVFIQAALVPLATIQNEVRILEMGFGTGLNALLSWRYARAYDLAIYYETIEAFPLDPARAAELNYAELLGISKEDFLRLHQAEWNRPVDLAAEFRLCKWANTLQAAPLNADFDVVYYDAFAPNAQPELWEADALGRMYAALRPGGVLVTYCAKGAVKRCLRDLGFRIEGIPGPPGKREMTRATKL